MTAPGAAVQLDLSLPDDAALRAAAAPADPWRERDRFAAGNPIEITELGEAFAAAGGDLDQAHNLSTQSQRLIADGFTNDDTPVYDQATHIAELPRNFRDAGTRLTDLGRRCGLTATELADRTRRADTTITDLVTSLEAERTRWRSEVAAANPIPREQVETYEIRRSQISARMQELVNRAGTTLTTSSAEYETILGGLLRMLADIGFVPPDELDVGPGDLNPTGAGAAAADQITRAVDAGPNPQLIDQVDDASATVNALNAKVAAGGVLTADEQEFLQGFYDRLATSGTLPRLEGAVDASAPLLPPTPPGAPSPYLHTVGTVADGLLNLSNVDHGRAVPPSVLNLLQVDPKTRPGGVSFTQAADTFSGTAALLNKATVDGGREFTHQLGQAAIQAKREANATAELGATLANEPTRPGAPPDPTLEAVPRLEQGADQLLSVVGRDAEASQDLLADQLDRQTLLGGGWQDGTGAASVITAATAPDQASPDTAVRSADLTATVVRELGADPQAWRDLIPKGSAVSNALTDLAGDHIGSFGTPSAVVSSVDHGQPVHNPDGSYTAGLAVGVGPDGRQENVDFLKFVAAGADPGDPRGDADIQQVRAQAELHSVSGVAAGIRGDADYTAAVEQAGALRGVLDQAEIEALVDGGASADQVAAQLHESRAGATNAAASAVGELIPGGPLGDAVKELVKGQISQGLDSAAPDATAPGLSNDINSEINANREIDTDRLLLNAAAVADPTFAQRHPELFADGAAVTIDDINADPETAERRRGALTYLTDDLPRQVSGYEVGADEFAAGREHFDRRYDGYRSQYEAPAGGSATFDDDTRQRIRGGQEAP